MILSPLEGLEKLMLQVELEVIRFAKEEDIPKQEKGPSLIDNFQFDDVTPANITQVNEWMSSLEDSERIYI